MSNPDPAALCARLDPWSWTIEAGCRAPPCHDPNRLLPDAGFTGAMALSLTSATLIGLSLGPALIDRLSVLGPAPGPLAGLALHELIANAVIHGNLHVRSGRAARWEDIEERQARIAASLADPACAGRAVTVALGWSRGVVVAVVADEGDGYDVTSLPADKRGAGRGLRLARMVGRLEVLRGGRQTSVTIDCSAIEEPP